MEHGGKALFDNYRPSLAVYKANEFASLLGSNHYSEESRTAFITFFNGFASSLHRALAAAGFSVLDVAPVFVESVP